MSLAWLVPVLAFADVAGLRQRAGEHLSVAMNQGAVCQRASRTTLGRGTAAAVTDGGRDPE